MRLLNLPNEREGRPLGWSRRQTCQKYLLLEGTKSNFDLLIKTHNNVDKSWWLSPNNAATFQDYLWFDYLVGESPNLLTGAKLFVASWTKSSSLVELFVASSSRDTLGAGSLLLVLVVVVTPSHIGLNL